MATMEYCAFENASKDLRVALHKLENGIPYGSLNEYEMRGLLALAELTAEFSRTVEGIGDLDQYAETEDEE